MHNHARFHTHIREEVQEQMYRSGWIPLCLRVANINCSMLDNEDKNHEMVSLTGAQSIDQSSVVECKIADDVGII